MNYGRWAIADRPSVHPKFTKTGCTRHRGLYFNLGRLAGGFASTALGFLVGSPTVEGAVWAVRAGIAYTTVGDFIAGYQSFQSIVNGTFSFGDLLGLLPAGAAGAGWVTKLPPLANGSSLAASSLSRGIQVRQVGNYFIKEVNPGANALLRLWGNLSLGAQAQGLALLGDMAPSFLYRNGKLITRNAGEYQFALGDFTNIFLQGSARLGTPLNDIRVRNIGANGLIFDPSLDPLDQTIRAILLGGFSGVIIPVIFNGAGIVSSSERK